MTTDTVKKKKNILFIYFEHRIIAHGDIPENSQLFLPYVIDDIDLLINHYHVPCKFLDSWKETLDCNCMYDRLDMGVVRKSHKERIVQDCFRNPINSLKQIFL